MIINTDTNDDVSPGKKKVWSSVVTICDTEDSDEEMSVFKQPGKKRKLTKNRDLVRGLLLCLHR